LAQSVAEGDMAPSAAANLFLDKLKTMPNAKP
jgi:hypothetical protein